VRFIDLKQTESHLPDFNDKNFFTSIIGNRPKNKDNYNYYENLIFNTILTVKSAPPIWGLMWQV